MNVGGMPTEMQQPEAGVECLGVRILAQIAPFAVGLRDIVNGGDIELQLGGQRTSADPVAMRENGLQHGETFVQTQDFWHIRKL